MTSADYWRSYAVVQALHRHREEPRTTVWEHLLAIHEEEIAGDTDLQPEHLIGDDGFSAELHRALIFLRRLACGETTVPAVVKAMTQFCATPDCTNTTTGIYCTGCEFERTA